MLVLLHDMSYVDQRETARLVQFGFWVLLVTLLLVVLVVGARGPRTTALLEVWRNGCVDSERKTPPRLRREGCRRRAGERKRSAGGVIPCGIALDRVA